MGLNTKVTSFQYTAGSTSNIVLSGWGFQPKVIICHWCGVASAIDSAGAGNIYQGVGFADGTRQNVASRTETNGGASSAGATYQRGDAVVAVASDAAVLDGYISVSSFDSGGVTLSVPDAISVNLTVMVIAIGGTDITNVYTGVETDNTITGNKSNTAIGFQPDILLFSGAQDANNAYPAGSNSEDGWGFGVAKASGAGNQYVVIAGEDDSSATMDSGSYIFDNEFMAGQSTTNPLSIFARKQLVSMDANGFTFNQLELPQTAGSQWNYLAIKGGNWYVGDLLTQTDTSTTVTETGMAASPALIIMASANRAKSTQDTGTATGQMSIGAATSTSERMVLAIQDENGTANAELSRGVEYDAIYMNISTSDAVQGLGDISAINSDGFTFIMDDADPSQAFAFWVAVAPVATKAPPPFQKHTNYIWRQ
jgi:hypothetical protein